MHIYIYALYIYNIYIVKQNLLKSYSLVTWKAKKGKHIPKASLGSIRVSK